MPKAIDLTGKKFGKLTVLALDGHIGKQRAWRCICDCRQKRIKRVLGHNLVAGKSKSCGCGQGKELPEGVAQLNSMFGTYRRAAKERRLEFKLTRNEFEILVKQICYYCGAAPQFRQKLSLSSGAQVNGIDRLDSDIGYVLANCAPCCYVCNKAKSDMSSNDFVNWINQVHSHLSKS